MLAASLGILERAQVPPLQARAILEVIDMELTAQHEALATKQDEGNLEGGLRHDMQILGGELRHGMEKLGSELRQNMETRGAELRSEIETRGSGLRRDMEILGGELRRDVELIKHDLELKIERIRSDLMRWVFGCILGQTAMLMGAAYFFAEHMAK
jgi:hypothetical protein